MWPKKRKNTAVKIWDISLSRYETFPSPNKVPPYIFSVTSEVKWSEVIQSCLTLCNPMDCCLPGSSILGIFQARVLEWVAISFSRVSFWPRDRTRVSCIIGRHFTVWATVTRGNHCSMFFFFPRIELLCLYEWNHLDLFWLLLLTIVSQIHSSTLLHHSFICSTLLLKNIPWHKYMNISNFIVS